MKTVNFELINKIFLHINRTEKQAEILPNRQKWNKLTSALYTLEDSSYAIEYYIETPYPSDVRGKYLFTYGLFQAIVLQALLDNHMRSWGYDATRDMVTKCEEELVKRYGTVETVDAYHFLLDEIHELYHLIDNIYDISTERQERLWHFLVELLFVKLHELEDLCRETDEYFENYGESVMGQNDEIDNVTINFVYPDGREVKKELME